MFRKIGILVILSLLIISNSFTKEINISGKILGYNGKPMPLANITVEYTGYKKVIEADKDGTYKLKIPTNISLRLTFTGVNHYMKIANFLIVPESEDIEINATMKPLQYRESKKMGVIGSFNDFSFKGGIIPLKKHVNGTFSAKLPNNSDTLFYQIYDAVESSGARSTNGTMQDFFTYDHGGDYRSAIITKEKEVHLLFDPDKYKFPNKEAVVKTNSDKINRILELSEKIKAIKIDFREDLSLDENKEKKPEVFRKYIHEFEDMVDEEKDNFIKDWMLIKYIDFAISGLWYKDISAVNQDKLTYAINHIPCDFVAWKSLNRPARNLYGLNFNNELLPYYDSLIVYTNNKDARKWRRYELLGMSLAKNFEKKDYIEEILQDTIGAPYILSSAMEVGFELYGEENGRYFYNILLEKYSRSKSARNAERKYKKDKDIEVGKQCPDFKIASIDDPDKIITLESLKGKYVLIDVWATWCGPCVGEIPGIHEAYDAYKDKNFTVLSISFDINVEYVHKYRKGKWKMPWLNAFAKGEFDSSIGDIFEVTGIPKPVLIDPNGKIIAISGEVRGDRLMKTLEKYLK